MRRWSRAGRLAQALAPLSHRPGRGRGNAIAAALDCHPVTVGSAGARSVGSMLPDERAPGRPARSPMHGGSGDRQDAGQPSGTLCRPDRWQPRSGCPLVRIWRAFGLKPLWRPSSVARPAVHRQGPRRGRALSPTRLVRVWTRRPRSGTRPHRSDVADDAPRPRPPAHDYAVTARRICSRRSLVCLGATC